MYILQKGSAAYYECMGAWVPCKVTGIKNGIISAVVTRPVAGLNYQIGEPLVSSVNFLRIFPATAASMMATYPKFNNFSYIED
jgi:hypothetical protein